MSILERAALLLLCTALIVSTAWALRVPLILGHDESVYAVMARYWLGEGPGTGVAAHRAPLLPAVGVPILGLGAGELGLRLVGLAAALGGVVSIWWLGRMMRGPVAGLTAAAVFVFAPSVFEAGTLFLTDLPAAVLLITLAGLLWSQFAVRPEPGRHLLLAAPLAWAAYELRYGSALVVILLFTTTILLFWSKLRRHTALALQTIGLLGLLLLPHLVNATLAFGSPWGRALHTARLSRGDQLGQGVGEYLRWFPEELAGRLAAGLMALGLAGTLVVWLRILVQGGRSATCRPPTELARGLTFLVLPALTHVLAIGLVSHGDPRFVFFAVALLCIAGAVILTIGLQFLARSSPLASGLVLTLLAFGVAAHVAWLAPSEAGSRAARAERNELLPVSADALRSLSGEHCSVLTTYAPQITWYASCASYEFSPPTSPAWKDELTDDAWMLLFEDGKRQPEGEALEYYLERSEPVRQWNPPHAGTLGSGALYRVTVDGG